MTESGLGILHMLCDGGRSGDPLVAAEAVSLSSPTSAHTWARRRESTTTWCRCFHKSLVLTSTITNPHIKGFIILVYKCFNDKK